MAKMKRLWIGEEDYGIAADKQAQMWLDYHRERYPDEPAHLEDVADDAPPFLPKAVVNPVRCGSAGSPVPPLWQRLWEWLRG